MRLLTLTCEYPPVGGGGATACRILCEALVRAGHAIDVVTAGMADLPATEEIGGVRVHRVPGVRRWRHYSNAVEQASFVLPMYRRAAGLLGRYRHDLCHCHFVVPTGAVASALLHRHGLPYVLTAHGSDVPGYNPDRFAFLHGLIAPAWRHILAGAAAVTSPSMFLAGLLDQRMQLDVEVLPNPFELPRGVAAERGRRVLAVSRLVERKGLQHLIAAMGALDTDWELIVAGDGPLLPELRRQAAEAGVRASFLGFVPREELAGLYAGAGLFVMPSLRENFPMVLLEAMAAGCAVVSTDAEGCAEVVGNAARLVPAGDVLALGRAIETLSRDAAHRQELGREAQRRARSFGADEVAGRFAALFARCLAAPGREQAAARSTLHG
ncbi:glycosyltransferase family 4 protein [Marinimicrococcus flavescens]|uniref:Glycosyltransferase family 4 protein n=1 Tax=Marinimicrococcus flavescens TaxID=3031815 RepID=A0AAP3UYJ5_9PROT|nr:glycosyltransferase family 4 protein [Marinimicrococcus flavescens]